MLHCWQIYLFSIMNISIMRNLIKMNLMLAKKFNNTMRYIDDLLTLNNISFHLPIDHIPSELQLKKTSESPTALSYLDTEVTIVERKYSTAINDKRDDFNFRIVNFPHLSSNISSGPAYGVYISQVICIGRICSEYSVFIVRHYKLTERLIHQRYRYSDLCRAFRKFVIRHREIIHKYNISIRKHV